MGRKYYKFLFFFLTVFVSLFSVFCPSLFYAKTYTPIASPYYNGSGITDYPALTADHVINSSVVHFDDVFAGGSVTRKYTKYDYFRLIHGPFELDNDYMMLSIDLNEFSMTPSSLTNITGVSLAFGTLTEIMNGDYEVIADISLSSGTTSTVSDKSLSFLNEYGLDSEYRLALIYHCFSEYEVASSSTTATQSSYISSSIYYDLDIYGVDIAGAYDLIYTYLVDMYDTEEDILTQLESINTSSQNISTKLSSILNYVQQNYNQLLAVNSKLASISDLLNSIADKLDAIQSELEDVNSELDVQTGFLERISSGISDFYNSFLEYIGMGSESNVPESPDTSGVSNQIQMEQELLGKDTSGAVNNLNITIDASANGYIWSVIDSLLSSNAIVFGGFISLLTIGVIKFFFGR